MSNSPKTIKVAKSVSLIDTTLLKKFIVEFEKEISNLSILEKSEGFDRDEYIIQMSKLLGYLSGIVTETTYLMNDAQSIIKTASMCANTSAKALLDLDKVLGSSGTGSAKGGLGGTN